MIDHLLMALQLAFQTVDTSEMKTVLEKAIHRSFSTHEESSNSILTQANCVVNEANSIHVDS
jgi:hypothetical protein